MAKQLVGPLERHLEKAVVALAGLVLIGAIGRYLITSPNQVIINGAPVPPSKIDEELVTTARAVRDRVVGVRSDVEAPDPVYDEFESQINPFGREKLDDSLVKAVAFGPPIPIIDPPTAVDGDKELVKVVDLDKPTVTSGRSTIVFYDDDNQPYDEVINWTIVSVVFDREKQSKRQALAYGGSRKEVTFGTVELQRRAQRPGGSWSDEDWEMVEAWPAKSAPPPPELQIVEVDGQLEVPHKQYVALSEYYRALNKPETQLDLLRPLGLEVSNGSPWVWPQLYQHSKELQLQDWDVLHPGDKPDQILDDRYGLTDDTLTPAMPQRGKELTFDEQVDAAFKLLAEARQSKDLNQVLTAYNLCFGVKNDIRSSGKAKGLAQRCMDTANLLQDDIERDKRRKPKKRPKANSDDDEELQRERYPRQQIWVIDAKSDSIPSGQTFQYRMRVNIYNRLAAQPAKYANPDDAKVVFIASEWSPPTDPVAFEAVSHMFATSFDERQEKISIEVFQWFDGEWVKGRSRFGVGDHMAFPARATTRSLEDPTKPVRALVDFETDATVVDIDFDRAYCEKKRGRTRDGVKLGVVGKACSVIYIDNTGELHEQFVPFDKKHPFKAELGDRMWKPERDVSR